MSLRSFIGLCEHRWQDDSHITAHARNTVDDDGPTMLVGVRYIQRCTICGKVRSVWL